MKCEFYGTHVANSTGNAYLEQVNGKRRFWRRWECSAPRDELGVGLTVCGVAVSVSISSCVNQTFPVV